MIKYRLATRLDNRQLCELTASTGMDGDIALRIDRWPDFFKLLDFRGESNVFVAEEGDTIIGSLCVSLQHVYIGGQLFPVHYIADFKVSESYRKHGIGAQLTNELAKHLLSSDADLVFLNVAKGNTKPFSFFKNRPNVPNFENIGTFNIFQIIGKKRIITNPKYKIETCEISDDLLDFLNSCYCKYELGSHITPKSLKGNHLFSIKNENTIIAAMCLTDTMGTKQNVVTRVSWKMKLLLKTINFLSLFFGTSKMPLLNEPVRMMYIKYIAVQNQDERLIKLLINHARNLVFEKSYSFVSMGIHEKDPLNDKLKDVLKLKFNSSGMLVSIKNNIDIMNLVKRGIPFVDYSLV